MRADLTLVFSFPQIYNESALEAAAQSCNVLDGDEHTKFYAENVVFYWQNWLPRVSDEKRQEAVIHLFYNLSKILYQLKLAIPELYACEQMRDDLIRNYGPLESWKP